MGIGIASLIYWYGSSTFQVVVPTQAERCLKHSYFIHKMTDVFNRGDLVSFTLPRDLPPFFEKGQKFMKVLAAVEGDKVTITTLGTTVLTSDGDSIYYPNDATAMLNKLQLTPDAFSHSFTVPDGQLFVLGTTQNSYDSRFWGTVPQQQVTGVGYAIF